MGLPSRAADRLPRLCLPIANIFIRFEPELNPAIHHPAITPVISLRANPIDASSVRPYIRPGGMYERYSRGSAAQAGQMSTVWEAEGSAAAGGGKAARSRLSAG